ncbi:MAG: homocysteine S-methyltransferase family protein [Candidatus Eremiobacteraeota bacterium]|nr:homocysteine S-methyltransferase family protein [Candidatus Eremiobacteraeota bacterium]
MKPWDELWEKPVIVLDGAMGTELIAQGLTQGECPDLWNVLHPEKVKEVHKGYYDAGSDIVLSNTFGASRIKLEPYGLDARVEEINRAGASLLKTACPAGSLSAGDMGPMGKFLKPVGPCEPEEFEAAFQEQAKALCDGGVDLIIIETMYDLREARLALKGALGAGLPVFVTMTFTKKKRGFFTVMGDEPRKALRILADEGAQAVGCNCSLDCADMLLLVESLGAPLPVPLIVKPNAGQPRMEGDKTVYDADPAEFASQVMKMIEKGARLAGGCCGTSPRFIETLRGMIKSTTRTGNTGEKEN